MNSTSNLNAPTTPQVEVMPHLKFHQGDNQPPLPNQHLADYDTHSKRPSKLLSVILFVILGLVVIGGLVFGGWYAYTNYFALPKLNQLILDSFEQTKTLTAARTDFQLEAAFSKPTNLSASMLFNEDILNQVFGSGTDSTLTVSGYSTTNQINPDQISSAGKFEIMLGNSLFKFGMENKIIAKDFYFKITDLPTILASFIKIDSLKDKWIHYNLEKGGSLLSKYQTAFKTEDEKIKNQTAELKKLFINADLFAETKACQRQTQDQEKLIVCEFKIKGPGLKDFLNQAEKLLSNSESLTKKWQNIKDEDWQKIYTALDRAIFSLSFTEKEHYPKLLSLVFDGCNMADQKTLQKLVLEITMSDFNQPSLIEAPVESSSLEEMLNQVVATMMGESLESARAKSRDAKRISDIKQIQTALELYYLDNNQYPLTKEPVVLGAGDYGCLGQKKFSSFSGVDCKNSYMGMIPTNPTPGGVDYLYLGKTPSEYIISFTLETGAGSLKAGNYAADPSGIKLISTTTELIDTPEVVNIIDTDQDGLSDSDEKKYKTNLQNPDTDNDGYLDGDEVKSGYNPLGPGKLP